MNLIQNSTPALLLGPVVDRTTGAVVAGAALADFNLSINGDILFTFGAGSSLTYLSAGYYRLVCDAGVAATAGRLQIVCVNTAYSCPPAEYMVMPAATYAALFTNAAGTNGGMFICGTNASLTITGAVTAANISNNFRVNGVAPGSGGGLALVGSLMGLANNAITSAKFAPNALTTAAFVNGCFSSEKFQEGFYTGVGTYLLTTAPIDTAPVPTLSSLIQQDWPSDRFGTGTQFAVGVLNRIIATMATGEPNVAWVGLPIRIYSNDTTQVQYAVITAVQYVNDEYWTITFAPDARFNLDSGVEFAVANDFAQANVVRVGGLATGVAGLNTLGVDYAAGPLAVNAAAVSGSSDGANGLKNIGDYYANNGTLPIVDGVASAVSADVTRWAGSEVTALPSGFLTASFPAAVASQTVSPAWYTSPPPIPPVPPVPTAAENAAAWGARVLGNGRTADYYLQGGFNKTVRTANSLTVYSWNDTTVLVNSTVTENGNLTPMGTIDPT